MFVFVAELIKMQMYIDKKKRCPTYFAGKEKN